MNAQGNVTTSESFRVVYPNKEYLQLGQVQSLNQRNSLFDQGKNVRLQSESLLTENARLSSAVNVNMKRIYRTD